MTRRKRITISIITVVIVSYLIFAISTLGLYVKNYKYMQLTTSSWNKNNFGVDEEITNPFELIITSKIFSFGGPFLLEYTRRGPPYHILLRVNEKNMNNWKIRIDDLKISSASCDYIAEYKLEDICYVSIPKPYERYRPYIKTLRNHKGIKIWIPECFDISIECNGVITSESGEEMPFHLENKYEEVEERIIMPFKYYMMG